MKTLFYLLLFAFISLLSSCTDETPTPVDQWSIKISSVTDSTAIASWVAKIDTLVTENYYQLLLNGKIVYDSINTNKFTVRQLKHSTGYSLTLKAVSNKNIIAETSTSFKTPTNLAPSAFTLTLDSLTSTSVVLVRGDAKDPERKKITYKLCLNDKLISIDPLSKRIVVTGLNAGAKNIIKVTAIDNVKNTTTIEAMIIAPPLPNALLFRHFINNRECTVYLPSGYSKNIKRPMIIYFHGATSYGWTDAQTRRWREVAESENIIIAYPQALGEPTGWGVEARYPTDDLPYATQLIDDLLKTYAVDPKRVYACGMSSGGFMTYYVGLYLSGKLAAIAPAAGLPTTYNFPLRPLKNPLPLLHIHSTKDDIVQYASKDGSCLTVDSTITFWVKHNQCSQTPIITQLPDINKSDYSTTTLSEYPNPTNGAKVLLYKINGGGHWWPGEKYGETDFVAEDVIWEFFKNFTKP